MFACHKDIRGNSHILPFPTQLMNLILSTEDAVDLEFKRKIPLQAHVSRDFMELFLLM